MFEEVPCQPQQQARQHLTPTKLSPHSVYSSHTDTEREDDTARVQTPIKKKRKSFLGKSSRNSGTTPEKVCDGNNNSNDDGEAPAARSGTRKIIRRKRNCLRGFIANDKLITNAPFKCSPYLK